MANRFERFLTPGYNGGTEPAPTEQPTVPANNRFAKFTQPAQPAGPQPKSLVEQAGFAASRVGTALPHLAEFAADVPQHLGALAQWAISGENRGMGADRPEFGIALGKFIEDKLGAPDFTKYPGQGYDGAQVEALYKQFMQLPDNAEFAESSARAKLPEAYKALPMLGSEVLSGQLAGVAEGIKGITGGAVDLNKTFRGAETPEEQLVEGVVEGVVTGGTGLPRQIIRSAIPAIGKRVTAAEAQALQREIAADLITGGVGGYTGTLAAQNAPEGWELAAGLAGGVAGGAGAVGGMRALDSATRAAGEYLRPAMPTKRNVERLASDALKAAASDPAAAAEAIRTAQAPEGVNFTAGQAANDTGLLNLEQTLARGKDQEFREAMIDRAAEQNRAMVENIRRVEENGSPAEAAQFFAGRMDELTARAAQLNDNARRLAEAKASMATDAPEAAEVGGGLQDALEAEMVRVREEIAALDRAIDPDGTMQLPTSALRGKVDEIYARMSPEERLSITPEEKALIDIIAKYGDVLPYDRFRDLRTQINEDMRNARSSGKGRAYGRMSQLRGALEADVQNAINGRFSRDASMADEFVRRARDHYTRNVEGAAGARPAAGAMAAAVGSARGVPEGTGAGRAAGTVAGEAAGDTGLPGDAEARRAVEGRYEQQALAGMFRDVEPRALNGLSREQRRAINAATDAKDYVEADLPTSRLLATQEYVNDDFREAAARREAETPDGYQRPLVVRVNGKNYVADGHHRIAAAIERGDRTVPVRFMDVDRKLSGDLPDARQGNLFEQAARQYPIAPRSEWYGEANYETAGGRMTEMTPDEFLSRARPLEIDDVARDNIDDLKRHILAGRTLDPLKFFDGGKEDGRHRAIAAKELGIAKVPVIEFGDQRGSSFEQAARETQTDLPAFRRWFGDSKVVDENGAPQVMYHSTAGADFDKFRRRTGDIGMHFGTVGQAEDRANYMRGRKGAATEAREGERMIPVYLSIKRPLRLEDAGLWNIDNLDSQLKSAFPNDVARIGRLKSTKDIREFIQSKGYDGIIYKNTGEANDAAKMAQLRAAEAAAWDDLIKAQKAKGRPTNGFDKVDQATPEYQRYREASEAARAFREGEGAADSYIAFDPTQIKSAIGNRGTFDPNDPNILHQSANQAATSPLNNLPEPTEAQKQAGNYKKGRARIGGLDISIENPAGSKRKGKDASGKPWSVDLKDHYGYVRGSVGKDGDHLDVFVKDGTGDVPDDAPVFVVDQIDPRTGRFDETKTMIGYADRAEAEAAYRANYAKDWKGLGEITPTTMGAFKSWIKGGKTRGQFAKSGLGDPMADRAIASAMAERFAAAGRPEPEARAAGELVDAFYATMAKRTGKTVEQVQEQFPLPQVRKGGGEGGYAQAAQATDTPAFRKWFGDSKVVDAEGKPLPVFHGTNQPLEQFDARRGGMSTGANAGATKGFFFTDSRAVAEQYATNAGERVVSNIEAFEKEQARLQKEVERLEKVAQRTGNWTPYEEAMAKWEDLEIGATREDASVGRNIVETYLTLKNPMVVDLKGGRLSAAMDMDAYIDQAKAAGNDGVIVRNVEDSPKMGIVSDHYVAFRPEQIKSVNNRGTFDASDPRIMYQAGKARPQALRDFLRYSKVQKPVYHATSANFDTFDTSLSDLGAHFGTVEQANKAAGRNRGKGADGPNIMPVYINLENPLRLKDTGTFHADGIAPQLAAKGWLSKAEAKRIVSEIDADWKKRKVYDQQMRDLIKAKGYDGVVYKNETEGTGDSYIAFEPNQIKSATGNRGTFDPTDANMLFQEKSGPRGSIQFDPTGGASLINLFEKADASTALHESAHQFLHMFRQFASAADAPEALTKDWSAAKAWWQKNSEAVAKDAGQGVTAADVRKVLRDNSTGNRMKDLAIDRGLHEQWARAFEVYLRDGKAPNAAMKGIFEQFKDWLTQVYRSITGMGVNLSPDIRGVFDRMLGGEEAPAGQMMDAAGAKRLKDVTARWKDFYGTFSDKGASPVPAIVKRSKGETYPNDMPAESVVKAVWRPGPEGAAAIRNVLKAAGPRRDAVTEGIEQSAMLSLSRTAMKDGVVDPAKFEAWKAKHADALKLVPAIAGKMESAADATREMQRLAAVSEKAIRDVQRTAIGDLLKLGPDPSEADVVRKIGSLMERQGAVKAVRELVGAAKRDPDAMAGLRRAVVDHVLQRFGRDDDRIVHQSMRNWVNRNRAAIAEVLTPEQMNTINAIMDASERITRKAVAPLGGSPTAEYLSALEARGESPSMLAAVLQRALGNAVQSGIVGGVGHVVSGMNLGVGVNAALGTFLSKAGLDMLRARGFAKADALLREAILNPELARALLMKPSKRKGAGAAKELERALSAGAIGILSGNREDERRRTRPPAASTETQAMPAGVGG